MPRALCSARGLRLPIALRKFFAKHGHTCNFSAPPSLLSPLCAPSKGEVCGELPSSQFKMFKLAFLTVLVTVCSAQPPPLEPKLNIPESFMARVSEELEWYNVHVIEPSLAKCLD